jgi:MFS family permease
VTSPHRSLGLLATAQALLLTNGVTLVAINALAGYALAPDKRLATLPVVGYVLGSAASTLPASLFMRRHGRRAGFMLGACCGMLGGAIGALAIFRQDFWLLCGATFCSGVYHAFGQYFRFAAAEVVSAEWKSRAISLTLAGGIVGGFIGPSVGKLTRDLLAPQYLASYASLIGFALASLAIAASLRFPPAAADEQHGVGRPARRNRAPTGLHRRRARRRHRLRRDEPADERDATGDGFLWSGLSAIPPWCCSGTSSACSHRVSSPVT